MKVLITQACAVPSLDGPQHLEGNSFADLEEDSARGVVQAGRGLYVDPKDDKTRSKTFTAPKDRIEAVVGAIKAGEKAAAKAAEKAAEKAPQ